MKADGVKAINDVLQAAVAWRKKRLKLNVGDIDRDFILLEVDLQNAVEAQEDAGSPLVPDLPSAEAVEHAAMVLERAAADSLVFADINIDRKYPWHELSTVAAFLRALRGGR